MLADKPTELSRIKLKTWTRLPVPMISEHSAHLAPLSVDFRTWLIHTYIHTYIQHTYKYIQHTYIHTYMFAAVNFDALAQARDIRIDRRQVFVLCSMQDSSPGSQTPNRWQTECPVTNRLSYRRSGWKDNLNSTARPYDQRAFSPLDPAASWLSHLALVIYLFVVNFDALAQTSDIRLERGQVVFLCSTQDSNPGFQTPNRQQTECPLIVSYQRSSLNNLELDSPSLW